MNVLLITVPKTCTQYFKEGLEIHYNPSGHAAMTHLSYDWESIVDDPFHDKIFTTYRDPHLVAASWANADWLDFQEWERVWNRFKALEKYKPTVLRIDRGQGKSQFGVKFPNCDVNQCDDVLGVFDLLKKGDMERFYQVIPKHLIDYAEDCARWVN